MSHLCASMHTQAAEAKRLAEEEAKRAKAAEDKRLAEEEAKRKAAAAEEQARKAAELKRQQEEDRRKQEAALNQLAEMASPSGAAGNHDHLRMTLGPKESKADVPWPYVMDDEDMVMSVPAHLQWVHADGSAVWQEQGSGVVRVLQCRHDGSVRVMMHHDSKRSAGAQLDCLLNHPVTHSSKRDLVTKVQMDRAPGGEGDLALFVVYLAADFSRGSQENPLVALRFATAQDAKEFERILDLGARTG